MNLILVQEIRAHLPASSITHGFGFHSSVTSLGEYLVSVMISDEIALFSNVLK